MKATGKRYLVQQIDFRANKVHCWGEVSKSHGCRTWHQGSKAFLLSAVDVSEVQKTEALCLELFMQGIDVLREKGAVVDVRTSARGNVKATIYPVAR